MRNRALGLSLNVVGGLFAVALSCCIASSLQAAEQNLLQSSQNNDQPIEITADTLEVRQSDNLAIFRGQVDAIQGDLLLRADVLVVHYREKSASDDNASDDQMGVSRIDVEGNVFVSSPKETAQGERGVYDVDNALINLEGNVVLTQGDNVITGDALEMNLATGESRVISDTDGSPKRVRGLFMPQKKKN